MSDDTKPRIGCGHVPLRFADSYLEHYVGDARAVQAARRAIERFLAGEIESLLLSGRTGCGKSMLAAIVCNETIAPFEAELATLPQYVKAAVARTWSNDEAEAFLAGQQKRTTLSATIERCCPRWVNVPTHLARIRRGMTSDDRTAEHELDAAAEASGILVLDDLGAERSSEWTAATVFEVMSARYDEQLRTIITSNSTASELAAAGYERIVSRLADGGALLEMTSATDYRTSRLRKAVA